MCGHITQSHLNTYNIPVSVTTLMKDPKLQIQGTGKFNNMLSSIFYCFY